MLGIKNSVIDFYIVEDIILKFQSMSVNFDSGVFGRVYFPKLRYIALRLLEDHGMIFKYYIPKIRTKRKDKVMSDIYEKLYVCNNK
jgi:hypothetical protein